MYDRVRYGEMGGVPWQVHDEPSLLPEVPAYKGHSIEESLSLFRAWEGELRREKRQRKKRGWLGTHWGGRGKKTREREGSESLIFVFEIQFRI